MYVFRGFTKCNKRGKKDDVHFKIYQVNEKPILKSSLHDVQCIYAEDMPLLYSKSTYGRTGNTCFSFVEVFIKGIPMLLMRRGSLVVSGILYLCNFKEFSGNKLPHERIHSFYSSFPHSFI